MRHICIAVAVLLQIFVLAYMAGEREHIVRKGKFIYLRTAPIDPRDLFRGDYVRLSYEISRIPASMVRPDFPQAGIRKGDKVYVSLKERANGLYEPVAASHKKPQKGVYIAGHIPHHYGQPTHGRPMAIQYGIEAYFVQQGKGREIERRLGSRNEIQVPLEMQIAVGAGGKSVIKGHRWSPVGMGLKILRSPPRNAQQQDGPQSAKMRLTLSNASDKPLALVVLPDDCSFSLEPVAEAHKKWSLAYDSCEAFRPTDDDIHVLKPQQQKSVDFDLSNDRWFVTAPDGQPLEIGMLDWSERFRMIYRPPDADACRHLRDHELIWHGVLPSRAFHGRGVID